MRLQRKDAPVTVAICIPCRDTMHSLFAYNLVNLIQYCEKSGIKPLVFMQTGSLISCQRQTLAANALSSTASHIMWLDSDMTFPVDIIERLLSRKTDIAACNYSTRTLPFKGVAYRTIGDWDSWLGFSLSSTDLVPVEGVGMGCMLTSVDVFRRMESPWFEVRWHDEYGDYIGEDFYFCKKARDLGYQIMIDAGASNSIGHIGISSFDLSNTMR